jgi:acylphosphatase
MEKRLHVYYSGAVQGVGFRFTTERVAIALGLVGWVKNVLDGRVEVVCEGGEPRLIEFLSKMKNSPMQQYITRTQVKWQEATGEFTEFTIRFY